MSLRLHPGARFVAMAPWLWCFAGCVTPLDVPSALSAERYLCAPDQAAAFEAWFAPCREAHLRDQSCAGMMSFKGVADAHPILMDTPVTSLVHMDFPRADGSATRTVFVGGDSPYFSLLIQISNLATPPGTSKSGPTPDTDCDSLKVSSGCTMNLEARGGNYLSNMISEVRDIRSETADELSMALTADLSRGGNLDGCFDVFYKSTAP